MFLPALLSFAGLLCASQVPNVDVDTLCISASTLDSLVADRQLPLYDTVASVFKSLPGYLAMDIFPLKLSIRDPVDEPSVAKRVNLELLKQVYNNQCEMLSVEKSDLKVLDAIYYPSTLIGKQENAESHLIITRQSATGIILSLFELFEQ